MKPTILLDYEFVTSASAYSVRTLLKLEGSAVAGGERVPLNLSLVLDRSGSMAGPKLAAVRQAATKLVRHLSLIDKVSVVAFDDTVRTVAPPTSGEAHDALAAAIAAIEPAGSTNLSGGWLRGRDYVAEALRVGTTNRVLLLTDGQANVGITDAAKLTELCRHAAAKGITTTTIGFGASYDEHLLRAMADAGGGNTYYIEEAGQAAGVFSEEIEGLITLCAQNVAVEVRPDAKVQLVAVHHPYPAVSLPEGISLEMGDLYAREPKQLLLEFLVPDPIAATEAKIADVAVRAHVLTEGGGIEWQEVTFTVAHPLSQGGRQEPEVRRELLLLGAAKAREQALEAQARGDYDAARHMLFEAATRLSTTGAADATDAVLAEELADLEAMQKQMEPATFTVQDAKYLYQRSYDAKRGRRSATARISRTTRPDEQS